MLQFIDKADQEIKKVHAKTVQVEKTMKKPQLDVDEIADAVSKKQQERMESSNAAAMS